MSLEVANSGLRRVVSDSGLARRPPADHEDASTDDSYSEGRDFQHTHQEVLKPKKKGLLYKMGLKKKKKSSISNSTERLYHSYDSRSPNHSTHSEPGGLLQSSAGPLPRHSFHSLADYSRSASTTSEPSSSFKRLSQPTSPEGANESPPDSDSSRDDVPVVRVYRPSCHSAPVSVVNSDQTTPNTSPVFERKESSLLESHQMSLSVSQQSLVAPPGKMFGVHITLMEGLRLAVRDRGGTSDPYVKFRLGEQRYRSRTIMKDLNPKWNESFILWTSSLQEPLRLKVYDYDRGWTDDFMGGATIDLTMFPLNKSLRRVLKLEDASSLEEDLGCLVVFMEITAEEMSPEGLEMVQSVTNTKKTKRAVTMSKLRQWNSILTVAILRGMDLPAVDANDCHPYCKVKMGSQRCKSRVLHRTTTPEWKEQFDLRMYEGESQSLHFEVWDRVLRKKDKFMGSCSIDLSKLNIEVTQEMVLNLDEGEGKIHVLLTISGHSEGVWSEESIDSCEMMQRPSSVDWEEIKKKYGILNSHKSINDVGFLQIKVEKALNLVSQRHSGCDPVAVIELGNTQVRTTTLSRTNNPVWNKTFNIHVKDIHDVLTITVYSGDSTRGSEFVGTVAIPLLRLADGPQSYKLKDKHCLEPVGKAEVFIESLLVYNPVRAGLRTIKPREARALQQPDKIQRRLLMSNVRRVADLVRTIVTVLQFVNNVFSWENRVLSAVSLLVFVYGCLCFQYWMPFALLAGVFIGQYLRMTAFPRTLGRQSSSYSTSLDVVTSESEPSDSEEEWEEETTQSLSQKVRKVHEVLTTTQQVLGFVADLGEQVTNLFIWSVPFCCWLAITVLLGAAGVLYFIPPRFIILLWGLNKFSKKLRNPNYIPNNELLDFLSRIPTNKQLAQWEAAKKTHKNSKKKNKKKQ